MSDKQECKLDRTDEGAASGLVNGTVDAATS